MIKNFSRIVTNNILFLFPIAIICLVSRVFPIISKLYYIAPFFLFLFIIAGIKEIKNNKILRLFLIFTSTFALWSLATSFWSLYPLISIMRGLYYLLITFGSTLGSYLYLRKSKEINLNFLLYANILVVALSLISLIFKVPNNSWIGGNGKGFMGFAGHQNTLGAVILFTMPASIWEIINKVSQKAKDKSKFKFKFDSILYLSLLILNFSFLILSYSRASILSFFAGVTIYCLIIFKWKFILISTIILLSLFFLLISNSFLGIETWSLLEKGYNDPFFTRRILWVPSYKAAECGGWIGLGYGISDPNIILTGTGSHFENGRYIREKGNSILAIIEETGLIGLTLFLSPIIYVLYLCSKYYYKLKSKINYPKLFIPFILALLLHAQFEAWWVGVGSFELPLLFSIFALILFSSPQPQEV